MPITISTAVEIVAEVKARLPLFAGITVIERKHDNDTGWVWVQTTAKPSDEDRKVLKEMGFEYSGKRGHWYHRAETVLNRRSFRTYRKPNHQKKVTEKSKPANTHVSLAPKPSTVSVPPRKVNDDEVARFRARFGNVTI